MLNTPTTIHPRPNAPPKCTRHHKQVNTHTADQVTDPSVNSIQRLREDFYATPTLNVGTPTIPEASMLLVKAQRPLSHAVAIRPRRHVTSTTWMTSHQSTCHISTQRRMITSTTCTTTILVIHPSYLTGLHLPLTILTLSTQPQIYSAPQQRSAPTAAPHPSPTPEN